MGDAEEVFNFRLTHAIASAMGAKNLEDYVDKVLRARNTHGTFGAEITWPHLLTMFRDADQFVKLVKPKKFLWLTRRDLVAQAVSIMALVQTNVAHTKTATRDEIHDANAQIVYNRRCLKRVITRLAWSEGKVEGFFCDYKVQPLRLWYEDITKQSHAELVSDIANHLEVTCPIPELDPKSGHQKMSGDQKVRFVERFKNENAAFLTKIYAKRGQMAFSR